MDDTLTPDTIMQLGTGYWGSKALLSAVELGLFTELAKGPLDGEVLRERLRLHARSARDFFDALVALGMLHRDGSTYRNTPETELFLDKAKPSYLGGILEMHNERLYGFWGSLTEGLKTGKPQNEAKNGGSFFDVLYQNPDRLRGFLQAMTGLSGGVAAAMANEFRWQDHKTFVDVGGAQGGLTVAIAQQHPHLSGKNFDLPVVEPIFEEYVAQAGLSDRLTFHSGDFFADPLPSADVLIMGHILHDWNLDEKRSLLAKAYEALPADGALIVYDAIIDDERMSNAFGLLMSLNMMIELEGGFDYTGADCIGWMRDAGFRDPYIKHLAGPDSMVVGKK
jgi:hypothetical protein